MILIVASTEDAAGMNISKQLIDHHNFEKSEKMFHRNPVYSRKVQNLEVKLVFVNEEIVNTQFITKFFSPQLLVFISKHRSASGLPTLSVHTPGNFAEAEMGGIPKRVSISPASAMRDALLQMAIEKEEMKLKLRSCKWP